MATMGGSGSSLQRAPYGRLDVFVLVETLDTLEDPRVERTKLHNLTDILALSVLAVICGTDSFVAIALYYQTTHDAIRHYDSHHLIPGDCYKANAAIAMEVVEVALPFVDVLSFQDFREPAAHLNEWHRNTGKRVLPADAEVPRHPTPLG